MRCPAVSPLAVPAVPPVYVKLFSVSAPVVLKVVYDPTLLIVSVLAVPFEKLATLSASELAPERLHAMPDVVRDVPSTLTAPMVPVNVAVSEVSEIVLFEPMESDVAAVGAHTQVELGHTSGLVEETVSDVNAVSQVKCDPDMILIVSRT